MTFFIFTIHLVFYVRFNLIDKTLHSILNNQVLYGNHETNILPSQIS